MPTAPELLRAISQDAMAQAAAQPGGSQDAAQEQPPPKQQPRGEL